MPNDLKRLQAAFADRYAIERELGQGGMATVFLATDLKHERSVAIKVLRPELSASLGGDRFLREIRVAATLQHPNILGLYDSGETEGLLYYVMPFIDGESLRQRLDREQQLPLHDALRLTREAGEALQYAHERGFVHRDIKPENILLLGGHALVADFGIARAVTEAGGEKLTQTGMAIGTPYYMSPEQSVGSDRVDARSDIYSLGCVLYEMLIGQPPFTGRTPQAVIARHQFEEPRSLHIIRRTVHKGLQQVIETALAKVPADRYQSARAFGEALAAPDLQTPRRPGSRFTLRPVLAVLGGLGVVVAAALLARRMFVPPRPLDPSRVVVFPVVVGGARQVGRNWGRTARSHSSPRSTRRRRSRWWMGGSCSDSVQRRDVRGLSASEALALARTQRAGWYIEGRVLLGDSVRASFDLHDVAGDSVVRPGLPA